MVKSQALRKDPGEQASAPAQSKSGPIPNDWLPRTVGDLIEFEGGSQPEKSVFRSSWKPGYVRLIQIRDYKTDRFETYIPRILARRFCSERDIMIGRYGPPIFQILRGLEGAYNVALIKAVCRDELNVDYAYYFLSQRKLFEFVEKLSQRSSGQTGVDLSELRRYPLPLPPTKGEQEAIAQVLLDVDALIQSLEIVIHKKRAIRLGVIQELVLGRRRLPGFQKSWETRSIGTCMKIMHGKSQRDVAIADGPYPILATGGQIGTASTYLYSGPSVLIGRKGTIDRPQYTDQPFWSVDTLFYSIMQDANVAKYFYYRFLLIDWYVHNEASGVPSLNARTIERIELTIPPSDEQQAIATVLSDLDAETSLIEERLSKTQYVKQGLNQELLTGKTRLV